MNKNRKIKETKSWKQRAAVSLAVGMAAATAVSQMGGLAVYAAENQNMQRADGSLAITKDETVYVSADALGNETDVTVSDWLKNAGSTAALQDKSTLRDIKNVKGDETFSQEGDSLVWDTAGEDIYYQGTSDEELPVSVRLTWYLDGEEMNPQELAGRSGHLEIKFDYTNRAKKTVEAGGTQQEIYSPFLMMTGLILPEESCTNVMIDNGKVISDGNRSIVVGFAVPGLKESLGITDFDNASSGLSLPESLTVSADVTDFEVPSTFTAAVSDLMTDMDLDQVSDLGDIQDALDQMEDAALELAAGSSELAEGAGTLSDGVESYTEGVDQLGSAVNQYLGTDGELSTKVTEYVNGVNTAVLGIREYAEGADALSDGITAYVEGEEQLARGASELTALGNGLSQVQDALAQISAAADSGSADVQALADGTAQMEEALGSDAVQDMLAQVQSMIQTGEELIQETGSLETGMQQGIAAPVQDIAATLDGMSGELQKVTGAQESLAAACGQINAAVSEDNARIAAAKNRAAASSAQIQQSIDALTARKNEVGASDPEAGAELQKSIDALRAAKNAADGLCSMEELQEVSAEQAGVGAIDVSAIASAAGTIQSDMNTFASAALEINAKLPVLSEKLDELENSAAALPSDSLAELSAQAEALNAGMQQLNAAFGGEEGLADSLNALKASTDAAFPFALQGIKELNAGFAQLGSYNDTLTQGAAQLKESSPAVTAGAELLAGGTQELASGLGTLGGQLSEGAAKLLENSGTLRSGALSLTEGAQTLASGMEQFEREGTGKLKTVYEEELGDILERLEAVTSESAVVDTFSGKDDAMAGSVKFIIETEAQ